MWPECGHTHLTCRWALSSVCSPTSFTTFYVCVRDYWYSFNMSTEKNKKRSSEIVKRRERERERERYQSDRIRKRTIRLVRHTHGYPYCSNVEPTCFFLLKHHGYQQYPTTSLALFSLLHFCFSVETLQMYMAAF